MFIKEQNFRKGKETILVVDDEKALLKFAEQILKNWGYKVLCAENAIEALAILDESSVDLLFTDVVMPGYMSGYELVEKAISQN